MSLTSSLTLRFGAVGLLALSSLITATAQEGTSTANLQTTAETSTDKLVAPSTDNRYRIGPGDVIEVRVARAPELSREAVRVDESGTIRMPMWDLDIPAACQTEGELAHNIATLYKKYKNDPHVDVFVKEFQSQPVPSLALCMARPSSNYNVRSDFSSCLA